MGVDGFEVHIDWKYGRDLVQGIIGTLFQLS